MKKRILILVACAFALFFAALLVNTQRVAKTDDYIGSMVPIERFDSAASHLSQAIQIKTISFGDTLPIDTAEFIRFRQFMESTYPLMHSRLERKAFNEFSYVFTWKGKDSSLAPYVLMAHVDVVPVEAVAESKWSHPSFSGKIINDTIWGRGAVDDKASAIGIMEAVEHLLQANYTPERTIYLCFGHDEEIAGRRGAAIYSKWFEENGIRPVLVLDEGGMIDTEKFKPTNNEKVLKKYGVSGPFAIFVGRITRQKGLAHLLRAWKLVDPRFAIVIAAGSADEPVIGAEVEQLISELQKSRSNVHWIKEMLPHDELVALLTAAQVFACPSIYEPLGIVNLEAMACETAVVASSVGGIPEVVSDGETGYLVKLSQDSSQFEAEFAGALNKVLSDESLAQKLGAAGRNRVVAEFGWDKVARTTIDLYRSLI